jgi:hypothetical protein
VVEKSEIEERESMILDSENNEILAQSCASGIVRQIVGQALNFSLPGSPWYRSRIETEDSIPVYLFSEIFLSSSGIDGLSLRLIKITYFYSI